MTLHNPEAEKAALAAADATPSPTDAVAEQASKKITVENAVTFGVPVLTALGIDPSSVVSFTLCCDGGEFPILTVKRVMQQGEGAAIALISQLFELRLKEQSAPERSPESVFVVGSLSEKLLDSDVSRPGS